MSSLAAKLSAANNNSDAQAQAVAASFSTINPTTEKMFQIRATLLGVKPATLKQSVALLTTNSLQRPSPSHHLLGGSIAVGAVGTMGLPYNPFHAVRFAVSQAFAIVVAGDSKSNNYESRVALLIALVEYASKQPNATSLLSESFEMIPLKTKGFELIADSILNTLESLGFPLSCQWAIAVGLCFSPVAATKSEGRRVLDKLANKLGTTDLSPTMLTELGIGDEILSNIFSLTNSIDNVPPVFQSFRSLYAATLRGLHAPLVKDTFASLSNSFSLAKLIEELGPNCVASQKDCKEMLDMIPMPLLPRHVAECLALFASPSAFGATKDSNAYNSLRTSLSLGLPDTKLATVFPTIPTFILAVREKVPAMNWTEVLQNLDSPHIRLECFTSIAAAYKKAVPNHNLPCEAFLGRWRNARIQSQALRYMIESPNLVDFAVSREVKITQGRGHLHQHVNVALRTLPESVTGTVPVCPGFGCIDFVEAVVYCMGRDKELEKVVSAAMREAPALLFAAFICCRPQGTLQHLALASQILRQSGPSASLTDAVSQHLVKEGHTPIIIGLFGDLVQSDNSRYVEAVETLTHAQLVPAVLSTGANLKLVVGCAIAGRETRQTPDNWFQDRLGEKREAIPSSSPEGSNRFAVAAALLEVCEELVNKQKFVGSTTHALKELFASSVAATLPAIAAHAKVLLDSGDSAFPADVEADANTLFRTFIEPSNANKLSPITECEKLYKSDNARDKQLFACVVHILFEECKVIGSYPWSSLTAAARLFGQLVDRNLLTNQRVQMALQFIHTAISKNDQRATEFGIMALECFYKRLEEWPHYGKQLRAIENVYLDMRIPGVMAVVNRSLKQRRKVGEEDKDAKDAASKEPNSVKDIGLHQHDITTLISSEDKFSVPTQIIQDQINFLVGNTDPSKLMTNAMELKRLVVSEYYPYFADYFVVKRVSLELNHHSMYLELLSAIGSPDLDKAIRVATVKAVDRVLKSDRIRTDASERSLLKNLGSWYGQITLARNIPVLARELNFKQMLQDGLRQGKLIAVVPFISKIMEHIVAPKCIFRPPNPWTMCQLEYLLEIYALRDLRITLRFEVEVLLKNIGVKPEDIYQFSRMCRGVIPRNYVSIADIREGMDVSGNNDFRADDNNAMYSQGGIAVRQCTPPPKSGGTRLTADAAPYQPQRPAEPAPIPAYPTIALSEATVVVTDDARYFPEEKLSAYRNAIVKVLDPVVAHCSQSLDRIVNIATYTTINLVLKDFPADSDPHAVQRACIAVARSLASNLCVNLRDTLHSKIQQFIDYLASQVIKDQKKEEFALLKETIYRNNFNVVLRVLESQAAERVVSKVREILAAFQKNPDSYIRFRLTPEEQVIMSPAPDVLRSRPPTAEQRAVFEEFFTMIPSVELLSAKIKSIEEICTKHYDKQSNEQVFSIFAAGFFDAAQPNLPQIQLDVRDRLNEIRSNCAPDNALLLMRTSMTKFMTFANRIVAAGNGDIGKAQLIVRDSLLYIMVALRTITPSLVEEVTYIYLNDNDRWKTHLLTLELLRHKLLDTEALDNRVATELNAVTTNKTRLTEFVRCLLDSAILSTPRVLQLNDVVKMVEALKMRVAAISNGSGNATNNTTTANAVVAAPNPAVLPEYASKVTAIRLYSYCHADAVRSGMRSTISEYLDEWVSIVRDRNRDTDFRVIDREYRKRSMDFMERLQRKNMLKSLDGGHLDCLIGTMLELGVEHYAIGFLNQERSAAAGGNAGKDNNENNLFAKIDAFNDLLQVLLRCCNAPSADDTFINLNPPEVNLITKLISVANKILVHNHDRTLNRVEVGKDAAAIQQQLIADGNRPKLPDDESYQVFFMQRPFVRFFSNIMLANVRTYVTGDPLQQVQFVTDETVRVVLENLNTLNPLLRPAFAFGWLELVCHRLLVPRALRTTPFHQNAPECITQNPRRHWSRYCQLLVSGLKFLDPFTKNPEGIPKPVLNFFRSFLKIMLVILHDFPEYILYSSYALCDAIPSCCIQLRNVVLCAFPNVVRLPDPFKYSINQINPDNDVPPELPQYLHDNHADVITSDELQTLILTTVSKDDVVRLVDRLHERTPLGGRKWNIPAINSLVVAVAVKQLGLTNQEPRMGPQNPAFRIYIGLAEHMDNEGRYYLINAFVNQLRYPNSHTRFFSLLILSFFLLPADEPSSRVADVAQEQIMRVIVERLVATRPHPWGLLVTFVELFREEKYRVWSKPFIRATPEVEKTIMQLARTINEPR